MPPCLRGEHEFAVRLGLSSARGLREQAARALVRQREVRPFASLDDLVRRVPELRKNELVLLAEVGALNSLDGERTPQRHRDTEKNPVSDFRASLPRVVQRADSKIGNHKCFTRCLGVSVVIISSR